MDQGINRVKDMDADGANHLEKPNNKEDGRVTSQDSSRENELDRALQIEDSKTLNASNEGIALPSEVGATGPIAMQKEPNAYPSTASPEEGKAMASTEAHSQETGAPAVLQGTAIQTVYDLNAGADDLSSKSTDDEKKVEGFIRNVLKHIVPDEVAVEAGKLGPGVEIPKADGLARLLSIDVLLSIPQLQDFERFLANEKALAIKQRSIRSIADGIAKSKHKTIDGVVLVAIDRGGEMGEVVYRATGDLKIKAAQMAGITHARTVTYRFQTLMAALQYASKIQCNVRKRDYMVLQGVLIQWNEERLRAAERRRKGRALDNDAQRGRTDKVIGDSLGVSATTVYKTKVVIESPEHCTKVLAGELTINSAYRKLMALKHAKEGDSDKGKPAAEACRKLSIETIADLFRYLYVADYKSFISLAKEHDIEAAIPSGIHAPETMHQSA